MKACELIERIFAWSDPGVGDYKQTCDTLKAGDKNREVRKVAVAMFATVELLREVIAWGADLLIVHEPTYYDHMDVKIPNDPVIKAKEELIAASGLVIYRYHDHPHHRQPDLICAGEIEYLGLKGKLSPDGAFGINRMELDEAVSVQELVERMKRDLGLKMPRVCGNGALKTRKLSLCFGSPGGLIEELSDPEVELVLTGEICEWKTAEYVRDAAALGFPKAMIVMGHIGSERDGMRLFTTYLQELYSELECCYFECNEVYL